MFDRGFHNVNKTSIRCVGKWS